MKYGGCTYLTAARQNKGHQMSYQIIYETNPKSEDIQVLNDGIMEQAKQKKE